MASVASSLETYISTHYHRLDMPGFLGDINDPNVTFLVSEDHSDPSLIEQNIVLLELILKTNDLIAVEGLKSGEMIEQENLYFHNIHTLKTRVSVIGWDKTTRYNKDFEDNIMEYNDFTKQLESMDDAVHSAYAECQTLDAKRQKLYQQYMEVSNNPLFKLEKVARKSNTSINKEAAMLYQKHTVLENLINTINNQLLKKKNDTTILNNNRLEFCKKQEALRTELKKNKLWKLKHDTTEENTYVIATFEERTDALLGTLNTYPKLRCLIAGAAHLVNVSNEHPYTAVARTQLSRTIKALKDRNIVILTPKSITDYLGHDGLESDKKK